MSKHIVNEKEIQMIKVKSYKNKSIERMEVIVNTAIVRKRDRILIG